MYTPKDQATNWALQQHNPPLTLGVFVCVNELLYDESKRHCFTVRMNFLQTVIS
jgi:hypothetical protein